MRKNKLPRKDIIKLNDIEKDDLIKATYNLSDIDLKEIRCQKTLKNKILCAGEIFYDRLKSNFPPQDFSAQFTTTNLSAIISSTWDDPKKIIWLIGSKISRYFKSVENFRKIWGANYGNVKKAKEFYPEIEFSNHDIVRGITIPEEMGLNMTTLFALYLTKGSLYNQNSGQFNLTARKQDATLYKKVLGPLINKIFNIDDIIKQSNNHKTPWVNGSYLRKKGKMDVNSKAHYTFLKNVMHFPFPKKDIEVPIYNSEEKNYATLVGLIAGMGDFISNELTLYNHDKKLVETTIELAKKIGFNPKKGKPIRLENNQKSEHNLYFNQKDIEKILSQYIQIDSIIEQKGMFINPNHINYISFTI